MAIAYWWKSERFFGIAYIGIDEIEPYKNDLPSMSLMLISSINIYYRIVVSRSKRKLNYDTITSENNTFLTYSTNTSTIRKPALKTSCFKNL